MHLRISYYLWTEHKGEKNHCSYSKIYSRISRKNMLAFSFMSHYIKTPALLQWNIHVYHSESRYISASFTSGSKCIRIIYTKGELNPWEAVRRCGQCSCINNECWIAWFERNGGSYIHVDPINISCKQDLSHIQSFLFSLSPGPWWSSHRRSQVWRLRFMMVCNSFINLRSLYNTIFN